ncbi:MAG: transglutaminase domain-containing protein [Nitrospirae bacterium]|nr:transglutaminase domain-containing protein [Nitrospirota bacterium]
MSFFKRSIALQLSLLLFAVLAILPAVEVYAKTIVLEGNLDSTIAMTQQMGFSVPNPVSKMTFRFALPAEFHNKAVSQSIRNMNIRFSPEPVKVEDETDVYGNRFKKVTWSGLSSDAQVNITFETKIRSELSAMESRVDFPLKSIPDSEKVFLKQSEMVQSSSPEISSLSKRLTEGAKTEYEAVTAILNYVADAIKYTYNPPQFDSLYTLRNRTGNCQNFAHLSMALLRAAGIPARIVGGISLKQAWKIPVDDKNYLVQSMGQGGHAWMEIFFPDLGWLSYDPQMSKQFTSSRHIKQTHGLDSNDINDSWRASPYVPEYNEMIDAKFTDDTIALKTKSSDKFPKSYLFSNNLLAKIEVPRIEPVKPTEPDKPIVKPVEPKKPEPIEEPAKPKHKKGKEIEFGNMNFPNLVDLYQVTGDRGMKILDKETAEYVTAQYVYAQSFEVDDKFLMKSLSLAMRKFGGDGSIYIDLVEDDNGKPNIMAGIRSLPNSLDSIKRRPGYYWVDFSFPEGVSTNLKKGRYWIVLRKSGEAIMNWFYIPGNPYGDGDDTRSTLKGYQWEDIQNFDFVFKVKGKFL